MVKYVCFFIAGIMLAIAATDSHGGEYDYPGQIYTAITSNAKCYSSHWWYDVDGAGPDEPQWVATESCFVKVGFSYDVANRKGWVHNKYIGVDMDGAVVDVTTAPLPFIVEDNALIRVATVHWYTYSVTTDLVRSSLVNASDASQDGPQILKNNQ